MSFNTIKWLLDGRFPKEGLLELSEGFLGSQRKWEEPISWLPHFPPSQKGRAGAT